MEIALAVRPGPDGLEGEYRGVNTTGGTILVFDRLYSMADQAMAPDWVYARVQSQRAELSRALYPMPRGLHHENPEVPYGREVAPGQPVQGRFRIGFPLRDRHPYAGIPKPPRLLPTSVTELAFSLGWAPMPQGLPPAIAPIDWQGERLWLLPYPLAQGIQQLASTVQRIAPVPGQSAVR